MAALENVHQSLVDVASWHVCHIQPTLEIISKYYNVIEILTSIRGVRIRPLFKLEAGGVPS